MQSDKQPKLTKYEHVKTVGVRAEQLVRGAQPFIPMDPAVPFNACDIAERELLAGKLPFIIVRTLPDGTTQQIKLNTLTPPLK